MARASRRFFIWIFCYGNFSSEQNGGGAGGILQGRAGDFHRVNNARHKHVRNERVGGGIKTAVRLFFCILARNLFNHLRTVTDAGIGGDEAAPLIGDGDGRRFSPAATAGGRLQKPTSGSRRLKGRLARRGRDPLPNKSSLVILAHLVSLRHQRQPVAIQRQAADSILTSLSRAQRFLDVMGNRVA